MVVAIAIRNGHFEDVIGPFDSEEEALEATERYESRCRLEVALTLRWTITPLRKGDSNAKLARTA